MIATLFDFNGVLVDDELVHMEAFREVLAPRGVVLEEAQYVERYLGFDDAGAFRAILTDRGMPATDAEIAALIEAKKPVYMRRIEGSLRVFPGAREIVARRAARGTVGIVSGALRHEIEHCLGIMGVREHVAFIVSAEDTTACKPDPQGYLLGVARLPAGARAVAVEDSLAGVRAARAAGLRCAAVTHAYPAGRLRDAGAFVAVATLVDLDDAKLDGGDA